MPCFCVVRSLVSINKVNRSARMLGLFAALLCLLLVSPNSSSATNLNVSLTCDTRQCLQFYFWWPVVDGPASGFTDFGPVAPGWSIVFGTAYPIAWCDDEFLSCGGTWSWYGVGGSVSMTAPDNLTFSGIVTGGSAAFGGESTVALFNFFGQWSNGLFATGRYRYFEFPVGPGTIELDTSIVPEPGSLVILGTGIMGAGLAIRRRMMA